jgi:hypothetical protein
MQRHRDPGHQEIPRVINLELQSLFAVRNGSQRTQMFTGQPGRPVRSRGDNNARIASAIREVDHALPYKNPPKRLILIRKETRISEDSQVLLLGRCMSRSPWCTRILHSRFDRHSSQVAFTRCLCATKGCFGPCFRHQFVPK